MNTYSVLDYILKDVLNAVTPLQEDWVTRFHIINDLREVVASLEILRGATVEPFGSFVSVLFSRWGDLDISIELSKTSCISSAGKKRKQMLLGELLKALRLKGGWRTLLFIPKARVPILKLKSNRQNISCDISIDNLQGQMKSKLLLWITRIDARFRQMVLLVKEWAKAHDINNSISGTFNSYSLSLLVIFHFQTCKPAIIPPLKDIFPRNMIDDLKGMRDNAEELIAETCDTNITRIVSDKVRPVNRSSLSELFISFLAKFSNITSMTSEFGVCPYTGRWEEIKSNVTWLPQTYALFIEDPFEQPENTARAVSAKQLLRISEVFRMTCDRLVSGKLTQSALLDELVRPQVSSFIRNIPRKIVGNVGGRYHPTRPQMHTSICSPAQLPAAIQHPVQMQTVIHSPTQIRAAIPYPVKMQTVIHSPAQMPAAIQHPVQMQTVIHSPAQIRAAIPYPVKMQTVIHSPAQVPAAIQHPVQMQTIIHSPAQIRASIPYPVKMQTVMHSPAPVQRHVQNRSTENHFKFQQRISSNLRRPAPPAQTQGKKIWRVFFFYASLLIFLHGSLFLFFHGNLYLPLWHLISFVFEVLYCVI